MIVTTTPDIEGRSVSGYLGVVAAQGVLGDNAFKDVAAGMRNIFGGRSQSYANEAHPGSAIRSWTREAGRTVGADAVIGVDIDYESVGSQGLRSQSSAEMGLDVAQIPMPTAPRGRSSCPVWGSR